MKKYFIITSSVALLWIIIVCLNDKSIPEQEQEVFHHTTISTDSLTKVAERIKRNYLHSIDSLNESLYKQQVAPHYLTRPRIIYEDSTVKVIKQKTIYRTDTVNIIVHDTLRQTVYVIDTIRQWYDEKYDERKKKKKKKR